MDCRFYPIQSSGNRNPIFCSGNSNLNRWLFKRTSALTDKLFNSIKENLCNEWLIKVWSRYNTSSLNEHFFYNLRPDKTQHKFQMKLINFLYKSILVAISRENVCPIKSYMSSKNEGDIFRDGLILLGLECIASGLFIRYKPVYIFAFYWFVFLYRQAGKQCILFSYT